MSNTNLKFLALIPYKVFPPNMGGQKGIALFYRKFSTLTNVTLYTIKNNVSNEHFEIINTISNSIVRYINPFIFFQLIKIANLKKCTHIIFEHPYYAWLLFLIKFFTPIKTIIHSHNIESERFKTTGKWWWKILWYYEKWAYKIADTVWFITENDKKYAIDIFKINSNKSFVITYGTELAELPSVSEINNVNEIVKQKHQIQPEEKILLFNGALGYKPNFDAVKNIIEKINPILLSTNFKYKIIICGKGLPSEMNELKEYADKNIIYAGFVEDIDLYFKACDIFINPVIDGGGIKTKLVEALGFGKNGVSTKNGAIGIEETNTDGRLIIVEDYDWESFAKEIIKSNPSTNQNETFYKLFSWNIIAEKALKSIL